MRLHCGARGLGVTDAPTERGAEGIWTRLRHRTNPTALAVLPLFLVAGLGDQGGNVFFIFANQHDALSVAVVMSSLYPVVTALWAAFLLHERLSRLQVTGVGLAAVAAGLIALG